MTREQYQEAAELYDMEPPSYERACMLERNQYSGVVFGMDDAFWLDHVKLVQMGAYDADSTPVSGSTHEGEQE